MGWRIPGFRSAHLRIAGDTGGGVSSLIAGPGISLAPASGVGDVTVTNTGAGTLAAVYTAGLGAPTVNNVFPQPGGKRHWTSIVSGAFDAFDEWYADRTTINLASPPAAQLRGQVAQLSGVGGNGCGPFDVNALIDPTWNGTFGAIGNMVWTVEQVVFSSHAGLLPPMAGTTEYARRNYFPNGASPFVPGLGQVGSAMVHELNLYSSQVGTFSQISRLDGYGMEERRSLAVQNGATTQWVTHWLNSAAAPAAGDGPTWWIDKDSRFGRFDPAAGLQAYQRGANQVTSKYGWKMFCFDGAAVQTALDINTDGGTLMGQTVPSFSTAQVLGQIPFVTGVGLSGSVSTDSLFQYLTATKRLYLSNVNAADTATMIGSINVQVEASANVHLHLSRNTTDSTGVFTRMDKSRGTRAAPTAVVAGDLTFSFTTRAYGGVSYIQSSNWGLIVPADAVVTNASVPQTFFVACAGGINPGSATTSWGLAVESRKNVFLGEPQMAANATDGFVFFPAVTGPPTGVPTYGTIGGTQVLNRIGTMIDATNSQLYMFTGGATWKSSLFGVTQAPGAVVVAITNAPAGVGGAPVEYWKVTTAGGTRYIALLG